jgi:uncharacterized protein (TIGR03067 family)
MVAQTFLSVRPVQRPEMPVPLLEVTSPLVFLPRGSYTFLALCTLLKCVRTDGPILIWRSTMRLRVLSLVAIALVVIVGSVRSDEKKLDLHGVWTLTAGEQAGEDLPADALKTGKLEIKPDNTYVFKLGEFEGEGKLKIDVNKKPHTVDSEMTSGQASGQTFQGIFEMVDENTMKQCYAAAGDDRPTRFGTKGDAKGGGQFYFIWKREKKS